MVYRAWFHPVGGGMHGGPILSRNVASGARVCSRLLSARLSVLAFVPGAARRSLSRTPAVPPSKLNLRTIRRILRSSNPPTPSALGPPAIVIPRLSREPYLSDFLTMKAAGEVASQMTRVSGFVQRDPHDGAPVSQRTDAYLGYDEKNLYVVFVCFDQPGQVRAHEARREDVGDDDTVEVMLDTFHDRRRAYAFQINPLGVQWDAIWSEVPHEEVSGNFDTSFDTLWYSRGQSHARGLRRMDGDPIQEPALPPDRGAVLGDHSLSRHCSRE